MYNEARMLILTNLLGVHVRFDRKVPPQEMPRIAELLTEDVRNWVEGESVGRIYAGGLLKLEPKELERMPISRATQQTLRLGEEAAIPSILDAYIRT